MSPDTNMPVDNNPLSSETGIKATSAYDQEYLEGLVKEFEQDFSEEEFISVLEETGVKIPGEIIKEGINVDMSFTPSVRNAGFLTPREVLLQ